MKTLSSSLTKRLASKYKVQNDISNTKRTNVNILLNRVRLDREQETRKKFYFTAVASTGLILFGLVVFS